MKKRLLLASCVIAMGFSTNNKANAQVVYVHHNATSSTPVSSPTPALQDNSPVSQSVAQEPTVTVEPVAPAPTVAPAMRTIATPAMVKPNQPTLDIPIASLSVPPVSPSGTSAPIPASEFGKDVPISFAVSSIVPDGYSVDWHGVNQDRKVSWSGGRPWKDTLWTLAEANGYHTSIQQNHIIITGSDADSNSIAADPVNPPNMPVTSTLPVQDSYAKNSIPDSRPYEKTENSERTQHSTTELLQDKMISKDNAEIVEPSNHSIYDSNKGVVLKTVHHAASDNDALIPNMKANQIEAMPQVSYAPKGGGEGIYYASNTQTADSVLQIWSNANGWRLQYDAKMLYPIDMPTTLRGDYMEVVRTLLRSISAVPKPKYKFYKGNHVLRIYNFDDGS